MLILSESSLQEEMLLFCLIMENYMSLVETMMESLQQESIQKSDMMTKSKL